MNLKKGNNLPIQEVCEREPNTCIDVFYLFIYAGTVSVCMFVCEHGYTFGFVLLFVCFFHKMLMFTNQIYSSVLLICLFVFVLFVCLFVFCCLHFI